MSLQQIWVPAFKPLRAFIYTSKMRITISTDLLQVAVMFKYLVKHHQILALNNLPIQLGHNPVSLGWPARPT